MDTIGYCILNNVSIEIRKELFSISKDKLYKVENLSEGAH